MEFLLKGFVIGISVALPVGPIGLLCIERSVMHGRTAGFISGLGAATADAVYGTISGFGIALISNFLIAQRMWIHLIGGTVLLLLGVRGLLSKSTTTGPQEVTKRTKTWWNYLSTFLLTISNPMTILSFAAVFAAIGVTSSSKAYISAALTVLGVFLGSTVWWLLLAATAGRFKGKLNRGATLWLGRLSGLILTGFGLFGIISSAIYH